MNRSYQLSKWSLSDLFPGMDSPEMEVAFAELQHLATHFETYRSELHDTIPKETFLRVIGELEKINDIAHRVHAFAGLTFAQDTQDQAGQVFMGKVEQMMAELANRTLFFELWWKALAEEVAERLMAVSGDNRYWLEEIRHFAPYTLSEPEEKVINIKDVTGSSALIRLYDSITNRYEFTMNVDGQTRQLTRGELMVYAQHSDPDVRAQAYRELYRVFGRDGSILGQIYQALVRDWANENVRLRGHGSPMAVRNLANDLPDLVVDELLEVCRENVGIFHRFFRLKARRLGLDAFRRYDLYAPTTTTEKKYVFSEAVDLVFTAFNRFDPHFLELAERVFATSHLDSEIRPGKQEGAFCASSVPGLTPWVLVNYQGRPRDVATLAHELGHAVHSMMAGHHSIFTFHASLPLAECASIFGEMVLIDHLLSVESDRATREDLLFRQLDDAYATITRQAFFALFEREAHEMIDEGQTVDELAEAYYRNLVLQFGETVDVADEFRWEWVSIPHFYHTPFYVYAYSFGQLLVMSLYKQYKSEGAPFKQRYMDILAAGGSDSPERILAGAGLNIRGREFWQGGFDVLDELVTRLEDMQETPAS
jgi:oligoendopeptidase F